jgi:molecular chaperone GrpE
MVDQENKGYSVEIPEEAVQEALKSVEKHGKRDKSSDSGQVREGGVEIAVEVAPEKEPGLASKEEPEERTGPSRQELIDTLEKAREAANAARDRMLRALADADNQRKRLAKEKQEIIKYNQEQLLRDLLPPLDNLERTVAHIPTDSDDPAIQSLQEGVTMVLRQFEEILARYELRGFSAVGLPFDPALHEALNRVEDSEVEPGTVMSEMHKGYMLHDRLLRAALVTVACTPGEADAEPCDEDVEGESQQVQSDSPNSDEESNGT